jgi:hypothetical protein
MPTDEKPARRRSTRLAWVARAAVAASLLALSTSPSDARPGGGQGFSGGASGGSPGSGTGGGSYGGTGGGGGYGGAGGSGGAGNTTSGSWAAANTPANGDPTPPAVDPNAPRMAEPRGPAKDRHKYAPTLFAGMMLFVGLVLVARSFRRKGEPSVMPKVAPPAKYVATRGSPRTRLGELAKVDPGFSVIVFEDFASALYSESVLATGRNELHLFSPYFFPSAERTMNARHLTGVTHVLMGAVRVEDATGLETESAEVSATLVFETNLARRDPETGEERAIYSVERWVLSRPKSARSRTPDKARVFGCPNCGAPSHELLAGRCRSCGEDVTTGAFDWRVASVYVLGAEDRGPMLTGETEERGTDLPTVVAPDAQAALQALGQRDPAFSFSGFTARVSTVFHTFHETWSARDLTAMRPFLSDALFATQSYWVAEYRRQLLRNVTENPTIRNVELARVTSDAYFDALTVRLHATCIDYTVSESGALVSGHRTEPRAYTEYWTFMRGREAKGPARTDRVCPRCGAPLSVGMAGACTSCGAKITAGSFDWVLSRIEQDDVYRG